MNLVFHSCWSVDVGADERENQPMFTCMLPAVTRLSSTATLDLHDRTGTVLIAMTFMISDGCHKNISGDDITSCQQQANCKANRLNHVFKRSLPMRTFCFSLFGFTNSTLETFSCANTDQCFREHRQVKTWKRNSLFKYLDCSRLSNSHHKCFDSRRYYWINERLIYAWSGDTQVAGDTKADVPLHKLSHHRPCGEGNQENYAKPIKIKKLKPVIKL